MSRTTPTIPIRAIPSTLSTRSSPSLPPSSTSYEPLVKLQLRSRYAKTIFLYAILFSWFGVVGACFWSLGNQRSAGGVVALLLPFRVGTLGLAVGWWAVVAVPPVVLRKVYLTPQHTPAASLLAFVKSSLAKQASRRSFVVYALSATAAIALYVGLLHANGVTSHGLGVFVNSRKHPYYLNGRLLFILLTQLSAASAFSLRNITLDRSAFRWSSISDSRPLTSKSILSSLLSSVFLASLVAFLSLPLASLVFLLTRSIVLPLLYKLPIVSTLLAPFTKHFIRSSASYTFILPFSHLGLLARAWGLACASIATWEFVNAIFDAVIFQPVTVGLQTPEPHVTLVSGATSTLAQDTSPYPYAYLAYTELLALSRATPESSPTLVAHRSTLFNDQKYNTPSLWGALARSALVLLGEDYQLFLRRGAPAPAPPATTANTAATPGTPSRQSGSELRPLMATPTPLIRTSIFQSQSSKNLASPGGASVADVFGSDGPLARVLDRGAEAVHVPELFRSVSAPTATAAVTPKKDVGTAALKGKAENGAPQPKPPTVVEKLQARLQEKIHEVLPEKVLHAERELKTWWTRERVERVVSGALPRAEGVVVIVEVLSHLVSASLTEDKYGVVQRDIPRILEALLSFLSAVEEYHAEIRATYVPPSPDATTPLTAEQVRELEERRAEVERAGEVLALVSDGLKAGVARIVRTFGDKLLAFKFPPRTAAKLQPFLDYC